MHARHHFQARPAFFTCCVCLKSFESRENLVSKLNASGRTYYVCKPCYHGEAPLHTCSQCSEKFATAHLLEAHVQTHKVILALKNFRFVFISFFFYFFVMQNHQIIKNHHIHYITFNLILTSFSFPMTSMQAHHYSYFYIIISKSKQKI